MHPTIGNSTYGLGTEATERDRLARLGTLLDPPCLRALDIADGGRVLDVGCGLGGLSRSIARCAPACRVVAVERDAGRLAAARRLAAEDGEEGLAEWRAGDAHDLPLEPEEWGTFDVAVARHLVEHSPTPERIVAQMALAVRPGGRVVLIDDDYAQLRVHPSFPEFDQVWAAFCRTLERMGLDPWIGRRLPALLADAGLRVRRSDWIFCGGCAGEERFELIGQNFVDLLGGARDQVLHLGEIDADAFDAIFDLVAAWREAPGAALWYGTCVAEARRPCGSGFTLTP